MNILAQKFEFLIIYHSRSIQYKILEDNFQNLSSSTSFRKFQTLPSKTFLLPVRKESYHKTNDKIEIDICFQ